MDGSHFAHPRRTGLVPHACRGGARYVPLVEQTQETVAVTVGAAAAAAAAAAEEEELQTTRIFAAGICCPMETPLVHSILEPMLGVKSVSGDDGVG